MNDEHLDRLIQGHLNGTLTEEERLELEHRLQHSAKDRQHFWEEASTHALIHSHFKSQLGAENASGDPRPAPTFRMWRSRWHPFAAAAAGLVMGLVSASLVFGFVVPSLKPRIEVFSEYFESGVQPKTDGIQPLDTGYWGGDFVEVVGPQPTLRPADGTHMLRLVRADHEGRHIPESFSCDSFRLVDLRPYRKELTGGEAVVRFSALFNGLAPNGHGPYICTLKLYALDAALVEDRKSGSFQASIRKRMLADSSCTRVQLDGDPATWQSADNELRLPPETEYLLLQVGMSDHNLQPGAQRDAFGAQFVDGIRLILAQSPKIPLR
jgi:hypothetical protein